MTRIKEPPIGESKVPNYKSPNDRIIRSLRKGYDNLREKVSEKSKTIRGLQGKLRDMNQSRENWKKLAIQSQAQIEKLVFENEKLKEDSKKKPR